MKLSISVLVLMLFLTACNDDRNDVPESEGAAPPEVAAFCNPGTRVYMSAQDLPASSTRTSSTEEAHRKDWISVASVEEVGQQVHMIKDIDSESPAFRSALLTGKRYERLTIEMEEGCSRPVVVYQAILSYALLTRIQLDASVGDDRLLESLAWDYMDLETTYTSINDKGGPGETISLSKNGRLYWR
jgi:type VI protein secretion system component Hcp